MFRRITSGRNKTARAGFLFPGHDCSPESFRREVETLPVPLRTLLEEELAVGNEIVDISHGFPAAPCGACVSLARDITCAPGPDLHARSWPNWNRCRGFTDEKGHFVLIGPPEPEPPQLSMDEIRARMNGGHGFILPPGLPRNYP